MNASKIFQQLMQQAGGKSGSKSGAGGVDIQGMLEGLSKQFGGGQSSAGKAEGGSGSSGFDMKSLLGGGALGMLVGSSRGRKLGGKALKYGALAGVGALAWKAWQNSQAGSQASTQASTPQANATASPNQGEPVERLGGEASEQRSLELLQALIMAARADGHVDEREQALLTEQIDAMGADSELHAWVEQRFKAPLDAEALARQADSPQAAREMYLVSLAVIDEQNPMERAWLDQLAKALKLDATVTGELERQARDAS